MSVATTRKPIKKEYITILSVLASFMVVALHVNGVFWHFSYDRYWVTANIIESIMYPAVPLFFMITGATLINYNQRYSTRQFFWKRFARAVVPFLAWSILAGIFIMIRDHKLFGFGGFISGIINCSFVDFYWFFPALFAVYLAIPFVAAIPEEKRKKWYGYAIILALCVNSLLPFVSKLFNFRYSGNFAFPAVSGYLIYALLGYWVDNYHISKHWRVVIYVLGTCGLLSIIIGTQVGSFAVGKIWTTFKGYTNIPCVAYAMAIFVFFKYLSRDNLISAWSKITRPFAKLTLGIYLIQWFVLQGVNKITWIDKKSILYRTLGAVVIYVICAVIVWCGSKLPIIKKIIA